jgi:hypothetical protein
MIGPAFDNCMHRVYMCQAFCPVLRIRAPLPLTPQWSVAPPLWVQGRRHTPLRGRVCVDPIPTKGQTLWYSVYYNNSTAICILIVILYPTTKIPYWIYRISNIYYELVSD